MCNIRYIVCKLESIDKSNVAISLSKIGKYYCLCSIKYFLFDIFFPKKLPILPFLLLHGPVFGNPSHFTDFSEILPM